MVCGPQDKSSGPSGDYGTFMVGTEGGRIFKCYNDVNDHNAKEFAKVGAAAERRQSMPRGHRAGTQGLQGCLAP